VELNKIIVISGPSGAGKTTLLNNLLDTFKDSEPLVRVTTRSKRAEDSLREYQYVPKNALQAALENRTGPNFEEMVASRMVINPVVRNSFSHGILSDSLTKQLPAGTLQLADLSPESAWLLGLHIVSCQLPRRIVPFFLANCSSDTLRTRMEERGESAKNIKLRLDEAANWQVEARASQLGYTLIDANQTKQEVLNQVVSFLGN
jgi:guanylate kinase